MKTLLAAEVVTLVLASVVFVVRYLFVPGWWRTPAGRHMMALTGTAGLFVGMLGVSSLGGVPIAPVWWALVLGALDVMLWAQIGLLLRLQHDRKGTARTMRSWLTLDARNRAWRTLVQGLAAVLLLPALDAGLQAVVGALADTSQPFDVRRTVGLAGVAALTAALMSAAAYVHRAAIDPIRSVPSALPPRPPGTSEVQAPATAPVVVAGLPTGP